MSDPLLEYRARLLDRLESVVPELADVIALIPAEHWHRPLPGGARSPHAALAHLRDVEREAYFARLQRLIAEDEPYFEPFNSPDWDTTLYDSSEPMTHILADYAGLREAELQILRGLTPAHWARRGRHTTLGLRTVQWWAERMLENAEGRLRELRPK